MAKRRNPKLNSVVAPVEVEEPVASGGVDTAPGVTFEGQAPAESVSELPAIAAAPAIVELSAAAPEATAAALAIATDETHAVVLPAETGQAVAMEAQPADAAVAEFPAVADPAASAEPAAAATPAEIMAEPALAEAAEVEPTATAAAALVAAAPASSGDDPAAGESMAQSSLPDVHAPADPTSAEIMVAPALAEIAEVEPPATAVAALGAAAPASNGDGPAAGEPLAQSSLPDAHAPAHVAPPLTLPTVVQAARNREFLARAATVALAAALGVIVGSLTTSALLPGTEVPASANAQSDVPRATAASVDRLAAEVATLKAALAANAAMAPAGSSAGNTDGLSRDIAVLKASFGESEVDANARLLDLVEQVNRVERAETDLATRLARIEKPPAAKTDVSPEITGSVAPASPPVAEGWVLWRVYQGRAVIQGQRGVFDVMPGADIPDLGVVREITKRDGRWVVITEKGMIVQAARRRLG